MTMKTSTWFIAAAFVTAVGRSNAGAQTAPLKWADTLSSEIGKAYESGDLAKVQAARAFAERVATAFPNDGLILHYEAFALYEEGNLLASRANKDASSLFTRALDLLEKSLKTHPLPETHALMASLDGALIAGDMSRAMELGIASQASQSAAISLGPKNPRVWLLRGVGAIFTPAEYGGGLPLAKENLTHAIELFATDKPKPGEPSWGHAEAYVWLGQVYEKMNDKTKAADAYKKAVEIAPNFMWAKSLASGTK